MDSDKLEMVMLRRHRKLLDAIDKKLQELAETDAQLEEIKCKIIKLREEANDVAI